jgi:hypothetical protein
MSYIAFLDLLGTAASTLDATAYRSKIRDFTIKLNTGSGFLRTGSKLRFFSDCAYVQAEDLNGLVGFLTYLRDSLLLNGTYLTAAVMEGTLEPREADRNNERICDLQGVSFFGEDISTLFLFQDAFKGAGIRLHDSVIGKLKEHTEVDSFYIPEIPKTSENEKIIPYKDVAFTDAHGDNLFRTMFRTTLHDALLAGSQEQRFGRNYIPLLTTFMRSRPNASLEWNDEESMLKFGSYPCQLIYQLSFAPKKVPDLYGLHFLTLVLLGRLYDESEHNLLTSDERRETLHKLFRDGILEQMYNGRANKMPTKGILDDATDKKIRKDYLRAAIQDVETFT